jgi:hypothetical protein
LFPPSAEGRESSSLLGCLGRATINHWTIHVEFEVDFATDGHSASSSWCRAPIWSLDQILNFLWSDNFLLLRVGLPLWREDGSVVCSSLVRVAQDP